MTEFEKEALAEMQSNDQEIDNMLDGVITKLDQLKFHAEDIHEAIDTLEKRLKRVGPNVERARQNLQKRNGEMASLLENYRRVGSCCKDFGLFMCLIVLVGCNFAVLKWKGVL